MSEAPPRRVPRAARPFLHGQYRILAFALVMSLLGAGIWLVAMVFEIKDTLGGGPIDVAFKLEENSWNVTQTAQAIDTPRSNLYKKLDQYEIRREE